MLSDLATCCTIVAKWRASAKPPTVDGLVPLRICRSSAVWAAVVVPWKVMTTLPDRSRNADALDGSSEACAAFSKVCRLGAGANRTGGGGRRRSGFSMNEVSSGLLLIALPGERSGEGSWGWGELDAVLRRSSRGSSAHGDGAAACPADLAGQEAAGQEAPRESRPTSLQAGAAAGSRLTRGHERGIKVSRVREACSRRRQSVHDRHRVQQHAEPLRGVCDAG